MKQKNSLLIVWILVFIFLYSCTSKNENIMRNRDIGFMVINKDHFENNFRGIVQDFNEQAFYSIVKEMDQQLNKSDTVTEKLEIKRHDISFETLYDVDDSSFFYKKKILEEVIQKYITGRTDTLMSGKVGIDILQPILFYTSSAFFRDKFYYDLLYYPPVEFKTLFNIVEKEASKSTSSEVEYFNPYYPLCERLEEDDQIYHLILKKEMLVKLKDKLMQMKATFVSEKKLECDLVFLEYILDEAMEDQFLLIMQTTP